MKLSLVRDVAAGAIPGLALLLGTATAVRGWTPSPPPAHAGMGLVPTLVTGGSILVALVALLLLRRDVAARLRAQSRQNEAEHRFHSLLETIPDALIIHVDGRIRYANEAARVLFGASSIDALVGMALLELVHPEDRPHVLERIGRMAQDGRNVQLAEERLLRLDGGMVYAEVVAAPVSWEGQPAVQAVARDVTGYRELQARLRLSQRLEAIGRMAGGVGHEFNNLLTTIACGATLAMDELGPAHPARQDLAEIQQAIDRASELTRRLVSFSGRQSARAQPLDVNGIVRGLDGRLRRALGPRVELQATLHPAAWPAHSDIAQLEGALLDLAVHARRLMPGGGSFAIATANLTIRAPLRHRFGVVEPRDYVVLMVRDSAPALTETELDALFDPFTVAHLDADGPTLGLAAVAGAMRQLGGHVVAESTPGVGNSFTLYLPVSAVRPVDDPTPRAGPARRTVLVVDDEESVRRVVARALKNGGCKVLEAENGEAALSLLADEAVVPDLVLVDILMPVMGGRELGAVLEARYPELPVIYMSGLTPDELVRKGLVDEAGPYLQKPFSIVDLIDTVHRALDRERVESRSA